MITTKSETDVEESAAFQLLMVYGFPCMMRTSLSFIVCLYQEMKTTASIYR